MIRLLLSTLAGLVLVAPLYAAPAAPLKVEAAFRPIELRGYSRAITAATIAAEVAGRVEAIHYEIGDTIAHRPLLQIDATFIELELQANAIALQRNRIAQQQAVTRRDWLQKEYERRAALVDQARVSRSAYEESEQQYAQAQMELQQQQQQQQQLQLERQELEQRLKRHQPTAPKGWRVSNHRVEPGEWLAVGTALMEVADYRRLVVPLAVTADELQAIERVNSAWLAEDAIHYRLHSVSPAFDEQTRKINIELEVLDFNGEQRGGLPLRLPLQLPDQGLMVPSAAVVNRYERPQVTIAGTNQPITVQVLNTQGDWLRIAPHAQLKPGTVLTSSAGN